MSAHKPVLGHQAIPRLVGEFSHECRICERTVVEVERTDGSTHWRHKPSGYRWGDAARYWRERALAAEAKLRASA